MLGWVLNCDLQRRGGGNDICVRSTAHRLPNATGHLLIVAGHVAMLTINATSNVCFGSQCKSNASTLNVTAMKEQARMSVTGSLQLSGVHSTRFSVVTYASTARASVYGDLRVKDTAYLRGGLVVARAYTEQPPLTVAGLVHSAADIKIEMASLQVKSLARLMNIEADRIFVQRKLMLCNQKYALQACAFDIEAASGNILAQGSIQVTGPVALQREVHLAPNVASVAQTLGHVEASHGIETHVVTLMPRVNHSVLWFNGTLAGVASSAVARGNLSTLVAIFQRRLMNVSASASIGDLQIRNRHNRTYVDRGATEQPRHKNMYMSNLSIGGNSEMKSLGAVGLLQVSPKQQGPNTLFSANPGSGDSMVQKVLRTRKRTLLNSAEFGPVQVYSYWLDFEN
jgi:hypothetical protein